MLLGAMVQNQMLPRYKPMLLRQMLLRQQVLGANAIQAAWAEGLPQPLASPILACPTFKLTAGTEPWHQLFVFTFQVPMENKLVLR